jgi:hypothetical protein
LQKRKKIFKKVNFITYKLDSNKLVFLLKKELKLWRKKKTKLINTVFREVREDIVSIKQNKAGCWWLTSVILATWEAEIRIAVQGQLGQIVWKTLFQKNQSQKRAGGVAQGEGPEFKP